MIGTGLRHVFRGWLLLLLVWAGSANASALERIEKLSDSSYWLQTCASQSTSFRPEKSMVPASTLKILTALHALRFWGPEHRFETVFYWNDETLWVKGLGDPYLTSEEFSRIVENLKDFLPGSVKQIGVDGSFFETGIDIPGREISNNAYDAPSSALAVNFNTVYVQAMGDHILSAEPQTPLTPIARDLALNDEVYGKQRISIPYQEQGVIHFGELLSQKLLGKTVPVIREPLPEEAWEFYRHANSKDLREVVKAMLKFSNNFIANQLFLNLGAAVEGAPASLEKSQKVFARWVNDEGLQGITVDEGSGLSRKNQVTAEQLVRTLDAFGEWKELLPARGNNVLAKTGTLNGVRTLAGFAKVQSNWQPFAIFVNQNAPHELRYQVLKELIGRAKHCPEDIEMTYTQLESIHE